MLSCKYKRKGTGNKNIANHFSKQFKKLYSCVSYDNLEMNIMLNNIDNLVQIKKMLS